MKGKNYFQRSDKLVGHFVNIHAPVEFDKDLNDKMTWTKLADSIDLEEGCGEFYRRL